MDFIGLPAPIGINILQAASVVIEDCAINGFTNPGGGIGGGIVLKPGAGVTTKLTVSHCHIDNNQFGIVAHGTGGGIIRGMVRDSVIAANTNNGVTVTTTNSSVVLGIERSTISGNDYGLVAGGNAAGMLVRNSFIAFNNTGLFTVNGGVLLSYRDNSLNGNTTTDGAFTGTVGQQ